MAIIGGLVGGGSIFGGLLSTAFGIGIKIAIAYFFPQKVQGPRAETLKAQTSKYGDHLARSYGTQRLAGAAIWLKGDKVDEHVRTYRQGKALGPEVTEFSYTATFAVAFAWNGPFVAVPRIWADDKLIYDESAGATVTGTAQGATITVYLGTEGQQSDPDIEADRGAGMAPAWPRRCYVVIKNLPLDEFGIRLPNIEAELIRAGDLVFDSEPLANPPAAAGQVDVAGSVVAYINAAQDELILKSVFTGVTTATVALSYTPLILYVSQSRNDVIVIGDDGDLRVYDSATGALKQTVTGIGAPSLYCAPAEISIGGVTYMIFWQDDEAVCYSNSGAGWVFLWNDPQGGSAFQFCNTFSIGPDYIYTTFSGAILNIFQWSPAGLGTRTAPTVAGLAPDTPMAVFYDGESDSVIVIATNGKIFVTTPDMGTVLASTTTGDWAGTGEDFLKSKRLKSASGRIAFYEDDKIFEYRISDMTLVDQWDVSEWGLGYATAYGGISQTARALVVYAGAGTDADIIYLPRISRGGEPLADVIEAECRLGGLVPDVTAITGDVLGYSVRDGSPPRGVIEDLARVNFFDFAQIDGVVTFFPRKTSAMRSITIAETGMALNSEPDPVQVVEEYPASLDIPEQVIIAYPSWDALYRQGAQAGNPDEAKPFNDEPSEADETGSGLKVRRTRALQFSTAQVLTDHRAAQVADIIFRDLADAATTYRTNLGPEHLDLHPGLVVLLPLDDTRTARAVLTKQAGETVLECEFRKRGDSFESEAVGMPTPYVEDTLLGMATATPALIDGHLLRADDDNDGFYAGIAITSTGQFRSGVLYQSEDSGATYLPWAAFSSEMVRGIAINALPDRPHPDAFDRATSFIIAVPQGTAPDSVTEAALLASQTSNGFAVWNGVVGDWEYIRAASVVDNLDGTWTLSTLLRGRKGTEFAMAGHSVGATVYYFDLTALDRMLDGDRTLPRTYVAVPTSTLFDSSGAVSFTNQGKGLRPWAPAFASAVLDSGTGDWTFTWHRRDRLGQEWPEDGAEDPPMSEDDEEYTVNIYDGMGVLVNSYTSATESYVYSAANQTTDFGSPQTSIEFGISQVSAIFGDGIELREAA